VTAALFAAFLVFLGWQLLISVRAMPSPIRTIIAAQPTTFSRQISADDIADAHLFGVAETLGDSRAMSPPPSSWHVIGVIVSDVPQESMADIEVDGAEQLWHVGDKLPDGSTLAEISKDGIKTTRSNELLQFDLRPASLDNRSLLTGTVGDDPSDAIAATPTALPDTGAALPDRMNALRTAGVAIWLKRIQQPSHPKPPVKPIHH
jgi:hypothetical protein